MWKKVLKIIENIVFAILLLVALLVLISLLPIKNNYKLYSVMSGSMEPTIGVGSMIISQPVSNYHVDNIITYQNLESTNQTTTHRIVEITEEDGATRYYTKGDANDGIDGNYITDDKIIGKYLFNIPYLGYLIGYIKTLPGLVLIIIIPATIIIYEEVKKIKKEGKKILKNKKATKDGKNNNKRVKNKRKDKNGK